MADKGRESKIDEFLKSQGIELPLPATGTPTTGVTNQPTRAAVMGLTPDQLPPAPKDEWERLARMSEDDPDAFAKELDRVPMHHDFLLTVGADDLDKFNTLGQLYGDKNVRGLRDGSFLVRELDKKTGKATYLRTDEEGLTWRDASDVVGGVIAATPEIAGWVAATSLHASKFPQHPYTKGGLWALTATGMAGGEIAGAAKDYAFRKWGIKQDPRTGEIAGRRLINFAIGLPVGWGLGKLMGGGKYTQKQVDDFQKLYDKNPEAFVKTHWQNDDKDIAKFAREAAEEMGIELPGAAMSLSPGAVTAAAHARRVPRRIPGMTDPMTEYEVSQSRGLITGAKQLTKGPVDYPSMGRGVRATLVKGEEQLRHWSQREAAQAVGEAETTALSKLPPQLESFEAKEAGDKLRAAVQGHAERRKKEVTSLYNQVQLQLATEGVVEFVDFSRLAKAINAWRAKLPTVEKEITTPSSIIGGKPTVQKVRTPIGKYDEASKKANDWVELSETPQILEQAQYLIQDLGEMSRAGLLGRDEGSIGFAGNALNKFYQAAKDDLHFSFDALRRRGKVSKGLSEQWKDANLQHAMKVEELNKSKFIKSALRSGRAGGKEVESAELLTQLIEHPSAATRKAELKLLKGMLEPAEYEELRVGLIKEMVGLNHPKKIINATDLPYVQPTSGRVVQAGEAVEIADLTHLKQIVDEKGNLGYLEEIFGGKKNVASLKSALDDFEEMQKLHGEAGRNRGLDVAELDNFLEKFAQGNPSAARQIMRNALAKEKDRRKIYVNLLEEAYTKGKFELIEVNPEQFVDDVILAGGNKSAEFGNTLWKELPDDVQDEVRRATAARIFERTRDIYLTPTKYMKVEGPEKMLSWKPKEFDFLKMLYEDPARQRLFQRMFSQEEIKTLDNYAALMQVNARMKAIGGSAGAMATETMIGTGNLWSLFAQFGGSRVVMSKPGQELFSGGQMRSGTGAWAWFIRYMNAKVAKITGTPESRAKAAKELVGKLEEGIDPTKIKMAMALAPPTADEVHEVSRLFWRKGKEYAGRDKGKRLGWETTWGVGMDGLPSKEEIDAYMEQELKKKKGK